MQGTPSELQHRKPYDRGDERQKLFRATGVVLVGKGRGGEEHGIDDVAAFLCSVSGSRLTPTLASLRAFFCVFLANPCELCSP